MKGFSLTELLVVVLLLSIILLGTFAVLTVGKRSWEIGTTQAEVQQKARRAMDAMVKEIRGASSIDQSTFSGGLSQNIIRFTVQSGTIAYTLSNDELQRTEGGATTTLTDEIAGIDYYLFGGNVVHIILTSQRQAASGDVVTNTINSQVVLRN